MSPPSGSEADVGAGSKFVLHNGSHKREKHPGWNTMGPRCRDGLGSEPVRGGGRGLGTPYLPEISKVSKGVKGKILRSEN